MTRITLALATAAFALLPGAGLAAPQNTAPVADKSKCPDLWQAVGIPDRATQGKGKFTIICHLGYITGHNSDRKTPEWVIERVRPGLATKGETEREGQDFAPDPAMPPGNNQATAADYEKSDFDQGHQAPAADFGNNQKFLEDTFFFTNAVPQIGAGFNRSIWRSLETQVRKLATGPREDLYVITGPIYQQNRPIKISRGTDACGAEFTLVGPENGKKSICPANRDDDNAKCEAGVAVPVALYKIVYDPSASNAFAILMENKSHTGLYKSGRGFDYIKKHAVSVATIEELTGLTFFTALDARKQRQIRQNCVTFKFH